MSTYILFGKYSPESAKLISKNRTSLGASIIKKYGGELKAGYILLGSVDVVLIVELPDTDSAIQTSVELTRALGIAFTTAPAVTVEQFDKLMS